MTGQRRIIAQVLEDSDDHPDVEELLRPRLGASTRAFRSPRSTAR